MASNSSPAGPGATQPPQQQQQQQQPQRQGRGRGPGPRHPGRSQQHQGRGNDGGGRGRGGGRGSTTTTPGRGAGITMISDVSGVPFGHVPGYLPGSSSLVEELDKRVLIVLRDGRHLIGVLRSFDQYSNMILDDASERQVYRSADGEIYYSDIPLGIYIVRGESLVLLGQVSPDDGMTKLEPKELEERKRKDVADKELSWEFDQDLLA